MKMTLSVNGMELADSRHFIPLLQAVIQRSLGEHDQIDLDKPAKLQARVNGQWVHFASIDFELVYFRNEEEE